MATNNPIYRRWNPPIATRIADIHGWLQDMLSAGEMACRLQEEFDTEKANEVLVDALSVAALVRYSRCFTTGIRARLSIAQLPTASIADVKLHERLRGIRDWNVSHPVNEQEVHALFVILDGSPGATTGAVGFSSFSSSQILQPSEVPLMLELCQKWKIWLKDEFVREQMLLMPVANRLSRSELLNLPLDEPQPSEDFRSRRKQSRK